MTLMHGNLGSICGETVVLAFNIYDLLPCRLRIMSFGLAPVSVSSRFLPIDPLAGAVGQKENLDAIGLCSTW